MRAAVDLHIHSALSPCADNEMTPNNIINMAGLKGLDFIAITDHNSAENLEALLECANGKNVTLVPGMEVETREEVHLICLFPDLKAAHEMQKIVYSSMPDIKNREDIFGQQLIFNSKDEFIKHCDRLLITAANLSLEEVSDFVKALNGILIPAHIDRENYSIISNLGMIPEHLNMKYLEVSKSCDIENYKKNNIEARKYQLIKSSDAHALGEVLERECFIELEEKSISCLIEKLKR